MPRVRFSGLAAPEPLAQPLAPDRLVETRLAPRPRSCRAGVPNERRRAAQVAELLANALSVIIGVNAGFFCRHIFRNDVSRFSREAALNRCPSSPGAATFVDGKGPSRWGPVHAGR